ncbi:MAG: PIN domain-containing protein [Acidobacteria bacterium]|nr:PIN domain-containing protein [Acidobacteriota bacterium]
MLMPDVNVLIYAHRAESTDHTRYAIWLRELAESDEPFALSELVMTGFLRIVTAPSPFKPPSTLTEAFGFLDRLSNRPHARIVRPGPRHWSIFRQLCESTNVRGKLIADAAHAALAIELGCEWVTADTDFARFSPSLRWRHL